MNLKQIGSLLLLAVGLYFIWHGIHLTHHVETPKDVWQKVSDFFTNNPMWNPVIEFFGGTPIPEHPMASHARAIVCITVGSILSLGGAALAFLYRKK